MNRGNAHKVEADAKAIATRYLAGKVSVMGLCEEYHVTYDTLVRTLHAHTTAAQRDVVAHRRREANKPTRWQKGHAPWNKGLKGMHLSPATEFKPGRRPLNLQPLGTITVRYDQPPKRKKNRKRKAGMEPWKGPLRRWIKVSDNGRPQDRWIPLARHLWAKAHGPVPAGRRVVHLDGNMMNTELANLRLVTPAEAMGLQYKAGRLNLELRLKSSLKASARRRRANAEKRKATAQRRKESEQRRMRARGLRELHGPLRVHWLCPACGYDERGGMPPDRCVKCGGSAFERLRLRRPARTTRSIHYNGRRSGRQSA